MISNRISTIVLVGAMLSLAACSGSNGVARDTVSGPSSGTPDTTDAGAIGVAATSEAAPFDATQAASSPTPQWSIASLDIIIPRSLVVSEANSIKPFSDIVWREDPIGDRFVQIEGMIRDALAPMVATSDLGVTPAILTMEITRFHALTERTRYTTGGEHEIEFELSLRDVETGTLLTEPRHVDLTFHAYGGNRALRAEAQGVTQRVRITGRLQDWARETFIVPRDVRFLEPDLVVVSSSN